MNTSMNTTMIATVLEVFQNSLLVRDARTRQVVVVYTSCARRFSVGDCVRITYNGVMTASLPPQITALSICLISSHNSCWPSSCRPCRCRCY